MTILTKDYKDEKKGKDNKAVDNIINKDKYVDHVIDDKS